MPIFQADLDHEHEDPGDPGPAHLDVPATRLRRLSEESIRTELCEGPVPDSPRPHTPCDDELAISSRIELIERLKRGESPTWAPNHVVNRLISQNQYSSTDSLPLHEPKSPSCSLMTSPKRSRTPSSLLPPAQITPEKKDISDTADGRLQDGLSIERPRSALHSGDFTEDEAAVNRRKGQENIRHATRVVESEGPWIATSPPRNFTPFQFERRIPFGESTEAHRSGASLSSSLSSNFVYKPPTSPLVQSESNEELEGPMPLDELDFNSSRIGSRRNTTTPSISPSFYSPSPLSSIAPTVPSYRREAYQAHQPRRSLTSTPSFLQAGTPPQSPALLRSRRSSLASDSSPLQHASMVGSYEESILRGRMSTTPSKPLNFLAQIGVLGIGKCKSSLRCPPHVTLSFPAVYYSYNSTSHGRSRTDDGPSPYVGQVDIENGLPNQDEDQRSKRKVQSRHPERRHSDEEMEVMMGNQSPDHECRRSSRTKPRSGSPKAPPGGSYRIPERGQIQIIIKNPNKTAVKLFLVPYDLTGMEPGTKTFVRQRSYSAGPIIENAPPDSDLDSSDRPILRYLVHLHICCPAKGRFYLYKSIRIVFANRVPDGKEKLSNETTWPEPRYTPYKPVRVMHPAASTPSGPGAILAAEKAFRRRSSGFTLFPSHQPFDAFDGTYQSSNAGVGSSSGGFAVGSTAPVDPIPFHLPSKHNRFDSDVSNATSTATGPVEIRSPGSSQASRPSTKDSVVAGPWGATLYEKLNKGDLGYGGNAFSMSANGSPVGAEGLLSQRLRSLGVKGQDANQAGD